MVKGLYLAIQKSLHVYPFWNGHIHVCCTRAKSRQCVWLCVTLWTIACQAPLSIGFSRQVYWSRLPCSPPGDLRTQGLNPHLLCHLHWWAGFLPLVPPRKPRHIYTELSKDKGILWGYIWTWIMDTRIMITNLSGPCSGNRSNRAHWAAADMS